MSYKCTRCGRHEILVISRAKGAVYQGIRQMCPFCVWSPDVLTQSGVLRCWGVGVWGEIDEMCTGCGKYGSECVLDGG